MFGGRLRTRKKFWIFLSVWLSLGLAGISCGSSQVIEQAAEATESIPVVSETFPKPYEPESLVKANEALEAQARAKLASKPQRAATGPRTLPVKSKAVQRPTAPAPANPDVWARLRQCESGGNYRTNTGNGYYGAYQFSWSTWASVGGRGNPAHASPAEQDARARALQRRSGWGQWPACSRRLGLR